MVKVKVALGENVLLEHAEHSVNTYVEKLASVLSTFKVVEHLATAEPTALAGGLLEMQLTDENGKLLLNAIIDLQ